MVVGMTLAPERHPNRDFFILDLQDIAPKDDTASAEHPFFSLSTRPDMRHLHYGHEGNALHIRPSGIGLPTIFDKDVLIFCISQIMALRNAGKPYGKKVRFSARDLLIATNRRTGGIEYKRLEEAFARLIGTTFTTNITHAADHHETQIFSMVDSGGFATDPYSHRLKYCEITLSDWMMDQIEATAVMTISPKYFQLRRPLERRIYEIARKHCGKQPRFQIGLGKLQAKTGSTAPLKKFRLNLRQIIADDHTPDYKIELDDNDLVTIKPRKAAPRVLSPNIQIPAWADEKARDISRAKGWDFHALESEFKAWAGGKAPPKCYGAAFVGFVKKKENLR